MFVRLSDKREIKLVSHEGGWRLPSDEADTVTIVDVRYGYGWMELPNAIDLSPDQTLTFYV